VSVFNLKQLLLNLSEEKREIFNIIFEIREGEARIEIPDKSKEIVERYGPLEIFKKQKIIRIKNLISGEETVYNEVRCRRPVVKSNISSIQKLIEESEKHCVFCQDKTVKDLVGEIVKDTCYTRGNLAAYDIYNSMVICKWHNYLKVTKQLVSDYLDAADEWWKRVYEIDHRAKYPSLGWNFGPKAGASQIHGHIQLISSYWPDRAAKERFEYSLRYKEKFKRDYWEDLCNIHEELGIGLKCGDAKILAILTPQLDKELMIISRNLQGLKEPIYYCVKLYIEKGEDFNLALSVPPFENLWEDFPYIVGIQSKGNPESLTANSGVRETSLVKVPIISTDPFQLANELKRYF
jgi:hypothetical protein